jgi:hypothetical protein
MASMATVVSVSLLFPIHAMRNVNPTESTKGTPINWLTIRWQIQAQTERL